MVNFLFLFVYFKVNFVWKCMSFSPRIFIEENELYFLKGEFDLQKGWIWFANRVEFISLQNHKFLLEKMWLILSAEWWIWFAKGSVWLKNDANLSAERWNCFENTYFSCQGKSPRNVKERKFNFKEKINRNSQIK